MMTLKTRWADAAMCDLPLPEYPRPQMVRELWMNLNGLYEYEITGANAEWIDRVDGKIRVPFAPESCLSGVCKKLHSDERLWYRRTFTLPESFSGKRVLLHFGAVDWQCKAYVNHNLVAEHTGGYCPFSADITDALQDGENELAAASRRAIPTASGTPQRAASGKRSGSKPCRRHISRATA